MRLLFVFWLASAAAFAMAQESSPSPAAAVSPMPAVMATPAPAASASPGLSPTPVPARRVVAKLMFLPPPMEGLISLGIYDRQGKLVRTLHREAKIGDFMVAADGLITHWDGLDDAGQSVPAGTYHARGYAVGPLAVRRETAAVEPASSPGVSGSNASPAPAPAYDTLEHAQPVLKISGGEGPFVAKGKLSLVLVGNPLDRDRSGGADVSVGFDAKGSWLQLSDGLPLKQISTTPGLKWAALGRGARPGTLVVFQSDGAALEQFTISKTAEMMAFDCGEFDYDPDKPGK